MNDTTDRTEYCECPDPECMSGGPHPVTSAGAELECRLCHVPFANPFYYGESDDRA